MDTEPVIMTGKAETYGHRPKVVLSSAPGLYKVRSLLGGCATGKEDGGFEDSF